MWRPDGAVDTHDLLGFAYRTAWSLVVSTSCELRKVTPGLGPATSRLDPAYPRPSSRTTKIHLLGTEHACAGGLAPGGRLRVVTLGERPNRVGVHLAVAPQELDAGEGLTCQGNLPAPYVLELGAPLAGRPLVDIGVHPGRRIT